MNESIRQVKDWREKAEAFRAAKKWAEAAEAYKELAKAWIRAAADASSPGGRADRVEESHKAELLAKECLAKAAKQVDQTGNRASQPSTENKCKIDPEGTDSNVDAESLEEDLGPCEPLEDLLKQLDALVGLKDVKEQVRTMIDVLEVRHWREAEGLPNVVMSNHLVFTGNPGTGKTTVARLIAKIYRTLGLLQKGQLVEADRATLVAGYVGQTAILTKETIKKALGGVLFIDEAYSLTPKGPADFGREAIDTLLKEMDDHRDNLVVIVAGYPDLMNTFINKTNPGLPSRFPTTIHFDDYSADDLVEVFSHMSGGDKYQYHPTADCLEAVRQHYHGVLKKKPDNFGNARMVRNLLEDAIKNQSQRLRGKYGSKNPGKEELQTLTAEDLKDPIAKQKQQLFPTE